MTLPSTVWRALLALALGLSSGLCGSCKSQPLHAPEPGLERMVHQEKLLPFAPGPDEPGPDGSSACTMRAPPPGTVARDEAPDVIPRVDRASLERGQRSFDAVCAACHGVCGDGDSLVSRRMLMVRPRDLLLPPVTGYDRARLVQVMTLGYGVMPTVTMQLDLADCWDIAGYVKALQLSRSTTFASLPPDMAEQARQALP